MKKIIALTAVAAICIASLAGCSGGVKPNEVHSKADLVGKTIGVQQGTTGDSEASKVEGATIDRYKKGADAIQALKQGKVDAVVIDIEPAKVFVEKNTDLMILDETFIEEEYAIAIKKNSELTAKINTALEELEADGTLSKIVRNWIGDEIGQYPYTSPEGVDRSNGKLVMATNAAFPPYESVENGKIVGIDADIMQAICDKLGYELKIEDMDFDAIISAVNSGKADVGVAGMSVTEDRLKNVDFSNSYTKANQVIVVRKK